MSLTRSEADALIAAINAQVEEPKPSTAPTDWTMRDVDDDHIRVSLRRNIGKISVEFRVDDQDGDGMAMFFDADRLAEFIRILTEAHHRIAPKLDTPKYATNDGLTVARCSKDDSRIDMDIDARFGHGSFCLNFQDINFLINALYDARSRLA